MSQISSHISLSIVAASALALGACGGSSTPPAPPSAKPTVTAPAPAPAPAAEPALAAAPAVAVVVRSVTLGNALGADGRIATPTKTFGAKDTIYAVILSKTAKPNAVVTARWTYQGGQLVKEEAQTVAGAGDNVTTLHISKPDGWPIGSYALDLLIDRTSISTTPFSVGEGLNKSRG